MKISCFEDLAIEAKKMTRKTKIAVVEAQDEHTLESVIKATEDGIMVPVLIGNAKKIEELLVRFGAEPSAFEILAASGVEESLQQAVRAGLVVREVPVHMLAREHGRSFITPVTSAYYIFKTLIVLLIGQLRPRQAGQ